MLQVMPLLTTLLSQEGAETITPLSGGELEPGEYFEFDGVLRLFSIYNSHVWEFGSENIE